MIVGLDHVRAANDHFRHVVRSLVFDPIRCHYCRHFFTQHDWYFAEGGIVVDCRVCPQELNTGRVSCILLNKGKSLVVRYGTYWNFYTGSAAKSHRLIGRGMSKYLCMHGHQYVMSPFQGGRGLV